MPRTKKWSGRILLFLQLIAMGAITSAFGQTSTQSDESQAPQTIDVDWNDVLCTSKTNATLQAVVTPLMSPDSPIHGQVWSALKDLDAQYVRYVPWLPYPRLAVAELEPPTNAKTSWDFSLIDPYTTQFFESNRQRPNIVNFSTIPQWMFKTEHSVSYPSDPNKPVWDYTQGNELRDPSLKELGDYYGRLVSWYTKGGFTDELGRWRASGHQFHIDYWEVLNEPDLEHQLTPEQYAKNYDAIVGAIQRVQPDMKFVGIALADTTREPEYFEYFLNPKNHKPGIPLDMISYHFYAQPAADEDPGAWQYSVFDQAARFVNTVRYIESIRRRLSPTTKTTIDEVGVILPADLLQGTPGYHFEPFPAFYWNLSAAEFAFLYGELSKLGIDAIGASALMQPPGFFPSVSMMNWENGNRNARYWVLKLIRGNFTPGDKIVKTDFFSMKHPVYAEGFVSAQGKRKVLLVNLRNNDTGVMIPGSKGGTEQFVDEVTGENPPRTVPLESDAVTLRGFSVAVVNLP
jgi:hypothetical protein